MPSWCKQARKAPPRVPRPDYWRIMVPPEYKSRAMFLLASILLRLVLFSFTSATSLRREIGEEMCISKNDHQLDKATSIHSFAPLLPPSDNIIPLSTWLFCLCLSFEESLPFCLPILLWHITSLECCPSNNIQVEPWFVRLLCWFRFAKQDVLYINYCCPAPKRRDTRYMDKKVVTITYGCSIAAMYICNTSKENIKITEFSKNAFSCLICCGWICATFLN